MSHSLRSEIADFRRKGHATDRATVMAMSGLVKALGRAIGRARLALVAAGAAMQERRAVVSVAAAPDAALLASAAALRRMGARITRYDPDESMLEARAGNPERSLAVRATETADEVTRLDLETEGPRALLRRFREELTRPSEQAPTDQRRA